LIEYNNIEGINSLTRNDFVIWTYQKKSSFDRQVSSSWKNWSSSRYQSWQRQGWFIIN
jgi:hypothetical protein